jgi:hypothetical protein
VTTRLVSVVSPVGGVAPTESYEDIMFVREVSDEKIRVIDAVAAWPQVEDVCCV